MELDLGKIKGFDWDRGNLSKSAQKHGVSPEEAEELFFRSPVLLDATRPEDREIRYAVIGHTEKGRWLRVVFTLRKNKIRPVSCRPANRKEISHHEKILRQRGQ